MFEYDIEPEPMRKEFVKRIDDNKIKIVLDEEERYQIKFVMTKGLSFYKYIREFTFKEITKELDILNIRDMENLYDYLVKSEYKINKENYRLIINNKEIRLQEKINSNDEMIRILIEEIEEIKNKNKNEFEKINKINEEKDNKIKILEKECKDLKEKINYLEENKQDLYKDEINLVYNTENEGECRIFGDKFVEINEKNIDLNINGKSSKLVSKYKLGKGDNNIKIIIKKKT